MEEQLPSPLSEIITLHFYWASLTFIVSILIIVYLLRVNGKLRLFRFVINFSIYMLLAGVGSFLLWMFWPFSFDIMFGPFNIPALFVGIIVILVLMKIQKPNFTKIAAII